VFRAQHRSGRPITERKKQPVTGFIEAILAAHGPVDLSLSPITVAGLVHGFYRAKTPEASQRRREYIEGQEAAKGNVLPFNDLMIAVTAIEQGTQ
jgi:predicted nucleic acid-binding protein